MARTGPTSRPCWLLAAAWLTVLTGGCAAASTTGSVVVIRTLGGGCLQRCADVDSCGTFADGTTVPNNVYLPRNQLCDPANSEALFFARALEGADTPAVQLQHLATGLCLTAELPPMALTEELLALLEETPSAGLNAYLDSCSAIQGPDFASLWLAGEDGLLSAVAYDATTAETFPQDFALAVCGGEGVAAAGGNSTLAARCALEDPSAANVLLQWPDPEAGWNGIETEERLVIEAVPTPANVTTFGNVCAEFVGGCPFVQTAAIGGAAWANDSAAEVALQATNASFVSVKMVTFIHNEAGVLAIDFVYSDGTTTTLNGGGSPGAFWVTSCALGPEETITTLELWASRPVGEAPTLPDTSLFGGLQWRTSTGGDCIVGTRTPGPGGLPQLQSMPVGGGVLAGAAGAWAEAGESGTLLGMLRLAFFAPVEAVTFRPGSNVFAIAQASQPTLENLRAVKWCNNTLASEERVKSCRVAWKFDVESEQGYSDVLTTSPAPLFVMSGSAAFQVVFSSASITNRGMWMLSEPEAFPWVPDNLTALGVVIDQTQTGLRYRYDTKAQQGQFVQLQPQQYTGSFEIPYTGSVSYRLVGGAEYMFPTQGIYSGNMASQLVVQTTVIEEEPPVAPAPSPAEEAPAPSPSVAPAPAPFEPSPAPTPSPAEVPSPSPEVPTPAPQPSPSPEVSPAPQPAPEPSPSPLPEPPSPEPPSPELPSPPPPDSPSPPPPEEPSPPPPSPPPPEYPSPPPPEDSPPPPVAVDSPPPPVVVDSPPPPVVVDSPPPPVVVDSPPPPDVSYAPPSPPPKRRKATDGEEPPVSSQSTEGPAPSPAPAHSPSVGNRSAGASPPATREPLITLAPSPVPPSPVPPSPPLLRASPPPPPLESPPPKRTNATSNPAASPAPSPVPAIDDDEPLADAPAPAPAPLPADSPAPSPSPAFEDEEPEDEPDLAPAPAPSPSRVENADREEEENAEEEKSPAPAPAPERRSVGKRAALPASPKPKGRRLLGR